MGNLYLITRRQKNVLSTLTLFLSSYDEGGQYLIAGAAEGHIFILDARPSKLFQVLGYLGNICKSVHSFVLSAFGIRILLNGDTVDF